MRNTLALVLGGLLLTASLSHSAFVEVDSGTGGDLTATYLLQTADASLPNAQALGALASGCLSVTHTTGVVASSSVGCGTVTSVATTSPITGGTITSTGTIACATCVTSAAALTSNLPVIGAGLQASAVGTVSGNTTEFATVTGALTSTHCVNIDASGNLKDSGAVCGGAGGATLDAITAAVGNQTGILNADFNIVWKWAATTDSTVKFLYTESAAATNGTSTSGIPNQVLLKCATLANSTASCLSVYSRGSHVFSVSPSTAQILATNGSVCGTPTYAFAANTNTGMSQSVGNLSLCAGGVTQVTFAGGGAAKFRAADSTHPSITDLTSSTTGIYWPGSGIMALNDSTYGEMVRWTAVSTTSNYQTFAATAFANLPAAVNGSMLFCNDCDPALTLAACASAATKTGAFAYRVNGAWICGG